VSGALIRGGAGSEIALRDILPSHLRGAQRERTEPIARAWEAKNPGSVVVCDWELFDDEDIAKMSADDRKVALADRAALKARKAASKKAEVVETSRRGGDPERMRESLRRAKNEIAMLDPTAGPDAYMKRFNELEAQIHELEDDLGLQRTEYKIGSKIETPTAKLTARQKAEMTDRLNAYRSLPDGNRKEAIAVLNDPLLAQLMLDVETGEELRDLLVKKIASFELAAATK
jgi:SpoVK/Ycf46/Vps4 family AAA+-type ATPase